MSDLIERSSAILAVNWDADAMRAIEELPSAQKWTPVSKCLPSFLQEYYATCKSLVDDRENWVISGIYDDGFDKPPMVACGKAEIIAWMPKEYPQPYKENADDA